MFALFLGLLCIPAFAQPVPNFTADFTSGCAPMIVRFQDQSTGNPTSWKWDLGNSTISFQQNPTATYFSPGSYTIKLIVQNAAGKDSITKINYIVVNEVPTVNFSASSTSGCYPLKVQFTDMSVTNSGTNVEWTWDFGDGVSSNLQNPQHTYVVAGSFGVTLKVKNSKGCFKFLNKPNYIIISGGTLANFTVGSNSGCGVPSTVGFNNTSTGTGVLSYQWFFGDGGTSLLQNPAYTYTAAGTYTVTLITSNNVGCKDTLIKADAIIIGNAANFSISGNCAGSPISFSSTSNPVPSSVMWNFGDGTTSTQLNPIKVYALPGTYQVKFVSDFGVCKDSITKPLTILAKPTSSFTQSAAGSCVVPLTVVFTNTSTGAASYQWLFGDGGLSNQTSPSHSYTQIGIYDVILIATNAVGCTDTLKKVGAVIINTPKIVALNCTNILPYKGCAPFTSTYSATIVSPDPIALYEWNFGDATSVQNGASPVHTYSNTGVYTITLIINTSGGCSDTFAFPNAVELSSKPTANFSATPINACAIDDIHFTDLSTGTIDTWNWTFGDGGSSILANPIYNYSDTGYFNVTLIVSNNFCKDTLRKNKFIYINPPIANFVKIFSCDTPFQRRFIDFSKGATSYIWDFGDGTSSTLANPVHVYAAVGLYFVKLTVTNGTCTHFKKDSLQITFSNPDFTINGSSFCKYADVVFTATNIDPSVITNYVWNYGDGTSSLTSSQTSTHTYLNSGSVTPSLITTDIYGCMDTVIKQVPIIIYGPKAGFANPPGGTCIFGTLPFIDTSSTDALHPILQWIWNYGDGSIDTLLGPPFRHQYNVQGTFDVKLSVKDAFGCVDTLVKPNAVLITKPVANFNTADTIRCSNSNVNFNNLSQGVNLTYQWNFGDTATSTLTNPPHAYTDTGIYSVKLIIKDLFGCTDTIFKPQYIHVANGKADYSFLQGGVLGLCYPFLVQVANKSTSASSISWSFGDGSFSNLDTPSHFYNYVGTYPLTLRAYGYGGCVDSLTKNIVVRGPTGTFRYTPLKFCKPNTVTFKALTLNNATFLWDFNDGIILTTTDSIVTHTYSAAGLFKPKMILIDAAGCQVPILGIDTIVVADVETYIRVPRTKYCDSVRLKFMDSTIVKNDVVSSYLWNFGDGTTSTQQQPLHFYPQPGNYIVKLTVTTSKGCTDANTLNVPISIIQTPVIKIGGDSTACVNAFLNFNGIVVKSDTSAIAWKWNFNNGNTSNVQNPSPQLYQTAGNFLVTAISSNASGCADTVTKNVLIHPLPNTDAGIDSVVCKGSSITLQPSGAASYIWKPDATLSCTICTNPIAKPDSLKFYKVTGYTSFGCSYSDSVLINVIQPHKVKISLTDTICVGESSKLLATGADQYVWTPSTGLNNANIPNPVATPTTTTTYTVSASDKRNCFTDTASVIIKVYPVPQFNIIESVIRANVGNILSLSTTSSPDIIKWKWLPDKWLSCSNCAMPNATVKDNIRYVAEASNLGGCITRDAITIEALCSDANIFIPNTFSPNGDGMNDVFYARGKGLFTVKMLKIFNRWGEVVFSKDNFAPNDASQGWDGTYKGAKLSSDVYIYTMEIICDNSQIIPVKGNVTLLR